MEHLYVPCYKGDWGFHVLNLYAAASAETESVRTMINANIYRDVSRYAHGLGRVLVIIMGDLNPTAGNAAGMGGIFQVQGFRDIMEEWYGGQPPNTYCRHGTYQGMNGVGVTRPDRAYANEEFFRIMQSARTINLKDNPSHAVLEVEVKVDAFLALFRTLKLPMNYSKQVLAGEHEQADITRWQEAAWPPEQERHFDEAVERGSFQRALQLWNHAAESFLMQQVASRRRGEGIDFSEQEQRKHCGRGEGPNFIMSHLTATSQRHLPEFGATSARITALAKMERRPKELAAKHKYLDKVGWEGEQALRINQEREALRDRISGLLEKKGEEERRGGQEGRLSVEDWEDRGHTLEGIGRYAGCATWMLQDANREARESRAKERA